MTILGCNDRPQYDVLSVVFHYRKCDLLSRPVIEVVKLSLMMSGKRILHRIHSDISCASPSMNDDPQPETHYNYCIKPECQYKVVVFVSQEMRKYLSYKVVTRGDLLPDIYIGL